ncbi:MAG TPA: LysE family transporter [Cyclobacteriaceae bacterium]|nr:LysE family transporter [Cyclobacteriaceae bacterium]
MEAIHASPKRSLPVFFWGLMISFLGSLPPGTTNILLIQLAATKGYFVSSWFALGCMLAEVICVVVCVKVMDRISQSRLLIKSLEWVSLLVITWLVVSSFSTVKDPQPLDIPVISGHVSPFVFGFLLMLVNPVQIPFWIGWTTILMERKTLAPDGHDNTRYVTGIAIGSLLASAIFIAGGHAISGWISGRQALMQWIFGLALVTIAITQVITIVRKRKADRLQGQ